MLFFLIKVKKNDKVTITKKYGNSYYYISKGPKGNINLWVKKSTVKVTKTLSQSKSLQAREAKHLANQYKTDKIPPNR